MNERRKKPNRIADGEKNDLKPKPTADLIILRHSAYFHFHLCDE